MKKFVLIIQNNPIQKRLLEKQLCSRGYTPISINAIQDLDYPYLENRYELIVSELKQGEASGFRRDLREVLNFGKLLIIPNKFDQTQFFPSYQLPGAAGLLL